MPSITLPPHAIHSYRWKADPKAGGDSVRSAAEGDTDVLLIDRLQTTLTTPAEHADAQTLLRAARLQTTPPQASTARASSSSQAAVQAELQTKLGALQLLSEQAVPARARAAAPAEEAAGRPISPQLEQRLDPQPLAPPPGQHSLGVAALWAVPLGLLMVGAATSLRRGRWQPLPTEVATAYPAAIEAPEEGTPYLEFAPMR